eukprot:TRINITY_DN26573_c0_g1_i2.p1 TRINITY_DN26573_c0_g1~~TRINITY_DN26573_c0_g1_i2.p1  ORF type:complete len:104 (-),score=12.71 TRINITY_DN26573_c0_g1_i2:878-1189(-)
MYAADVGLVCCIRSQMLYIPADGGPKYPCTNVGSDEPTRRELNNHLAFFFVRLITAFTVSFSAAFCAFFLSSSACLQFSSCARRNIRTKFKRVAITAFFSHYK